jgi:hypothetical protein
VPSSSSRRGEAPLGIVLVIALAACQASSPGMVRLAVGFGSVWLRNYDEFVVQRLDLQP